MRTEQVWSVPRELVGSQTTPSTMPSVTTAGSVTLPAAVTAGMVDGVVWVPTNAKDCSIRSGLGTDAGGRVHVTKGGAA